MPLVHRKPRRSHGPASQPVLLTTSIPSGRLCSAQRHHLSVTAYPASARCSTCPRCVALARPRARILPPAFRPAGSLPQSVRAFSDIVIGRLRHCVSCEETRPHPGGYGGLEAGPCRPANRRRRWPAESSLDGAQEFLAGAVNDQAFSYLLPELKRPRRALPRTIRIPSRGRSSCPGPDKCL